MSAPAPILPLLIGFTVKGTIVLLAALALGHRLRRASAACRHLVWSGALAALLLLPLAGLLLPAWSVPGLPSALAGPAANVGGAAVGRAPVSVAAREAGPLLLVLWGAGAAFMLARWCAGWIAVARLRRRAFVVREAGLLALADDLAQRLNVRRPVALLAVEGVAVPLTWGVFRPVILLPASALRWEAERLRLVLAHELGHVRRYDVLTQALSHLALALAWFHPLAWRVARRERAERERACDDLVLGLGALPSRYAGELLAIAQAAGAASRTPAVAAALAEPSELEGRLLAILAPRLERGGPTRRGALALAAAFAALLGLASVEPAGRADRSDRPDAPDSAAPVSPVSSVSPADPVAGRDLLDPPDPRGAPEPADRAGPPDLVDPAEGAAPAPRGSDPA